MRYNNKKLNTIIIFLLFLMFVFGSIYIIIYSFNNYKDKKVNNNILNTIEIEETKNVEEKNEKILKLEELKKKNEEIVAWLEIEGTNISYPILQSKDNKFYLTHNYKKEKSSSGSLFLDKDFDTENLSNNYLIYGHRNKNGLMFEELMKYTEKDFYEKHIKITLTTNEENIYEIIAIFYSKVYYKNEENVFKYYNFVNFKNEEEYNYFISNAKKASIYDIDITAKYGEQLLTLSTCEYSQEDGRFVVLAKKIDNIS